MESNIDIKELWNRQTVPAADQSEILNKISHFRKNGLKKGIFLDVILVLTILFMIFIWIYFKPQFLSTNCGNPADVYCGGGQSEDNFFV